LDDPWEGVWDTVLDMVLDRVLDRVWVWDSSGIPCSKEKNHKVVVLFPQGTRCMISAPVLRIRTAVLAAVLRSAIEVLPVLRCIAISVFRTAAVSVSVLRIRTMIDYDLVVVVVVDLDVVEDVVHVVVDAVGVVVCALTVAVE